MTGNISLSALELGYTLIPFMEEKETQKLFQALEDFFSKPEDYQKQFSVPGEVEVGYAALSGKKCFVIRNQQMPDELKIFLDYIPKVHAKALAILSKIETQMGYPQGQLTNTISKVPLPESGKAASLLRLFSYDPSETEGIAVAIHEDLGLLTITPRSPVAGLEVWDYSGTDSSTDSSFVKLEKQATPSQATVLVGETLNQMTQGHYLPSTHQVTRGPQRRFSIVYHLRAEPHAKIREKDVDITIEEWMKKQKSFRTSVNNSY